MGNAHIILDFPSALIGPEETQRIMLEGNDDEAAALLRNPSVSAKLLEALYTHTTPCATLSPVVGDGLQRLAVRRLVAVGADLIRRGRAAQALREVGKVVGSLPIAEAIAFYERLAARH
jgi:hypothetical protein